ncbi:polymer-forming cytoskeletal protein [Erythrobacter sp. YT30]|uniref:polymer-forming cytoskeletal protein n=1 Tax=Erythrobacter sp. YT30 TaxID=1735012 RepID=UPI00076C8E09|nr:polymer-forming cytoskeletal protein [Erythrobacter sp. YT30]KWV92130.1 hypothetical protein AUC45_13425 [Erythrobacter sp. YT30]
MTVFKNVPLKRLTLGLIAACGALALPASTVGQSVEESNSTNAFLESDMVFAAAEDLNVSQKTTDDLFAAGSTIEVSGAEADHLFLAGGDLRVSNAQVNDLIAAGGDIQMDAATVADDVIIAGGEVVARETFEIGGTAVVAGGEVRFEAPVGQDLRIGANEIFVNSVVSGTARLSGDTITFGPRARIEGDLIYRGSNLVVDPAAVIEGERTQLQSSDAYEVEDAAKGVGQFFLFFSISMIISYFVIVALLVLIVPRVMHATSQMLGGKPLQALGIGVLFAFIVPVLGVLLFWTGVGIPLAIFLFVASLALTPIAVAVTAHFIGMAARKALTRKAGDAESTFEQIMWPLGGVVVLLALALIPIVGLVVMLLAMLFGLGAFGRQVLGMLSNPPQAAPTAPAMA